MQGQDLPAQYAPLSTPGEAVRRVSMHGARWQQTSPRSAIPGAGRHKEAHSTVAMRTRDGRPDGTSVSRSSMGRRTAAEIRDLASHASQAGSAGGARQRRASAMLSEDDFTLPSQSRGKSRQPLTATMSALGAAKARLGIPAAAASAAGSRNLLGAVAGRDRSASLPACVVPPLISCRMMKETTASSVVEKTRMTNSFEQ